MIIYLSGPMTGIEENNYPAFNKLAKNLREGGHSVINPTEVTPPAVDNWNEWMKVSLKAMMDADAILLMTGWEKSKGAVLENFIAEMLEYKIIRLDENGGF